MKRVRVPQAGECPDCFERVDAASSESGRMPSPGDFSVCAMCGAILRYSEDLQVRRINDGELDELQPDQREILLKYHHAFRAARKAMTQPNGPEMIVAALPKLKT